MSQLITDVRRAFVLGALAFAGELHPVSAAAAPPPDGVDVHRSATNGAVTFIEPAKGDFIPITIQVAGAADRATSFLEEYGALMGVSDAARQLVATRRQTCNLGQIHTTYQQMYRGVPVFSGIVKVHEDAGGRILAANGRFHRIKERVDLKPALSRSEAAAAAASVLDWDTFVIHRAELTLVDPGWYGDQPSGVHLAYHLEVDEPQGRARQALFIDAHSGEVIDQWSDVPTLRERAVFDGNGEGEFPEEPVRVEGDPPVDGPIDVNRAYDYLGDFYDYLFRAFERDSIDGMGLPLQMLVNSTYGSCPNARWSTDRQMAIFCDGLLTDDVVAHELTHGLTRFTANMIYQNQPGQLNESCSDVFGELVDLFNGDAAFVDQDDGVVWPPHPTGPGEDLPNARRDGCVTRDGPRESVRWLLAEEITALPGPLRDMWSPECEGDPGHASSLLQVCSALDSGGVHSGSGIPNHAFAMLTDGATFNGFTIRGIGPIKSGAVWYRALTIYMSVASDFEDGYVALTRAADDLVGTYLNDPRTGLPIADAFTADDARQVDLALQAVEMNTPGRCGQMFPILSDDPPPPCGNRVGIFLADFEEEAEGWSVAHSGPDGPATPYDWTLSGVLPFGRQGRAWFCADPDIGDCELQDEAAIHTLTSPPITLPDTDSATFSLSFAHYAETEPGWDGGFVRVRTNRGRWAPIPATAFTYGPYNGYLRTVRSSSSNPAAGAEAFTGVGGEWGTSRIDLTGFASGGDTIEIRFDFAKDGCIGLTGWYVDDVAVDACWDCDGDGVTDDRELHYANVMPTFFEVGVGRTLEHLIVDPPRAASDVTIAAFGMGDFAFVDEYVAVELNGEIVGHLFAVGAQDCASIPNATVLTIEANVFNALTNEVDAVVTLLPSDAVSPTLCSDPTYVRLFVHYETTEPDDNDNGTPDECERCVHTEPPRPSEATSLNRYLSVVPPDTGEPVALRVTLAGLPPAHGAYAGTTMWVGEPRAVLADGNGIPGRLVAPLRCVPVYRSWTGLDRLDVFGPAIVPGGVYEVGAVRAFPGLYDCATGSISTQAPTSTTVETAPWGDVVGAEGASALNGASDFLDIAAAVAAFSHPASLDDVLRADVFPDTPDQVVDMNDIALIITAANGGGYPFRGPDGCR